MPPALGNAAFAVVVVVPNTPSLVAMSTPSTVPVTPILPVTFTGLLKSQLVVACVYVILALAPPTVIPAPLASELSAASDAILKLRSSIATVVELIVVCVPSTCKSPAITTLPVLSPTAAGSIVNTAGPAM